MSCVAARRDACMHSPLTVATPLTIFQGTLPTEFGSMTACRSLVLADNDLTGTIPTELGSMTSLESNFRVNRNKFTGE